MRARRARRGPGSGCSRSSMEINGPKLGGDPDNFGKDSSLPSLGATLHQALKPDLPSGRERRDAEAARRPGLGSVTAKM